MTMEAFRPMLCQTEEGQKTGIELQESGEFRNSWMHGHYRRPRELSDNPMFYGRHFYSRVQPIFYVDRLTPRFSLRQFRGRSSGSTGHYKENVMPGGSEFGNMMYPPMFRGHPAQAAAAAAAAGGQ